MPNYIDKEGLITLITEISKLLQNHTSPNIEINDLGEVLSPNNFPTIQSIVDYLRDRKKLIINLDISSPNEKNSYDVKTETLNYNGEEEILINIGLISAEEIDQLFN